MLARLQQGITVALSLLLLGWVGVCLASGRPGWAVAGAIAVLLGHAVVLGLEGLMMALVNHRDPLPSPTVTQWLRAWWGEVCTAPRVFCWNQPFRAERWPDRLQGVAGQRGVLLVHGFVCNRGVWNCWLAQFHRLNVPVVALNLEPVFGDIDTYAPQLDAAVQQLHEATGLPPLVVAHSMGGLAVRAWLQAQGGEVALARIHHVLTIGTPHRGTALAVLPFSANTRQMGLRSLWVQRLAEGETDALRQAFTCVYSNCDNIVFPTSTAILRGAQQVAVEACAHVHLLDHPLPFRLALGLLGLAPPPPGR